ncbi:MAG TPA: rhomboid family intramembrane serine protease [Elusimicrobiota bacterium]|nr:rhomboid family intramembrane serine protease [Elusimicrobiota bacterium]
MFPIRDNVPSRSFPAVNLGLIGVNAYVFVRELAQGPHLDRFLIKYSLVPARLAHPPHGIGLGALLLPFLTSMFLHGGWMHVIGNMWSLWIFGDNVEDRLGHLRYLAFYLLCGLAAAALQVSVTWGSRLPMLGASGAIAGVMGAYLLLFPSARILTFVPIFFIWTIEVPAFFFIGGWIWSQVYAGSVAMLAGAERFGGVAWWAHVGGFVGGMLLLNPMLGGAGVFGGRR